MNENKIKIIELGLVKSDVYLLVGIFIVKRELSGEDLGREEDFFARKTRCLDTRCAWALVVIA